MNPIPPPAEQVPLPKKKPLSALGIVLIVLGATALVCAGAIGAGVFWIKSKAEQFLQDAGDGGLAVAQSPEQVRAQLAGDKRDYVGSWRSDRGSQLEIGEDGSLSIVKAESAGARTQLNLPIAGFRGEDIVCRAFVTLVIRVTQPPSQIGGRWEMVADGITFHRP